MRKMASGRLLLTIFSLVLAGLACNLPGGTSPTSQPGEQGPTVDSPQQGQSQQSGSGQETLPGYQEILPGQPAGLTTPDGAGLSIPAGAYDDVTAVRLEASPESSLPQTTTLHQLISNPYELDQAGYAGQVQPLELTIPYNPAALPEGVSPQALTIVWWDGESWQDVASTVDEAQGLIKAEIHHFSTFAAAWSRFKEMAASEGYFNDGQVYGQFNIHYTTRPPAEQSSFWPWSSMATDDRPSQNDADDNGVPDLVEQLGQDLLLSRTFYIDFLAAQAMTYPADLPIDVYMADIEPAAGFYDPVSRRIVIDNDRADNVTAAHELFHYLQYTFLPRATADQFRWWLESTAEWAEDQVFDETNAYYGPIRRHMPNPSHDGYGRLHSRNFLEFYAAASLVNYLELNYPGFVLSTFKSTSGLSQGKSWNSEFDRLLNAGYGASFEDVMDDYFASYFYHWDFDDEMPFVLNINDPAILADPLLVAAPGLYTRVGQSMLPISGRLVTVEAGSGLEKASLVVAQGGQGLTPFVYAYADNVSDNLHTRVPLPASGERLGSILGGASDTLLIKEFGQAASDLPVTQLNLVATNTNPRSDVGLDLEIYLLEPPENFSAEDPAANPLRLNWTASPLPIGHEPGEQGALVGYRLYHQVPGSPPKLLAEIDPTEISYELSRERLNSNQGAVSLFMRTVDKYQNESPDSDSLDFGASLTLESATATESNCFISSVNDWEFCDITVNATLLYSAQETPATIGCSLASTSEGASVQVQEKAGSVQLQFTDKVVNMENRDAYPSLGCTLEPTGTRFFLPYNFGTFKPTE